jgi:hypothetical protein
MESAFTKNALRFREYRAETNIKLPVISGNCLSRKRKLKPKSVLVYLLCCARTVNFFVLNRKGMLLIEIGPPARCVQNSTQ